VALIDMTLRLGSLPRKLEAVCQTYGVDTTNAFFHNAGEDADYTLLAFRGMLKTLR
jgi:hypothetical protein